MMDEHNSEMLQIEVPVARFGGEEQEESENGPRQRMMLKSSLECCASLQGCPLLIKVTSLRSQAPFTEPQSFFSQQG